MLVRSLVKRVVKQGGHISAIEIRVEGFREWGEPSRRRNCIVGERRFVIAEMSLKRKEFNFQHLCDFPKQELESGELCLQRRSVTAAEVGNQHAGGEIKFQDVICAYYDACMA